MNITRMMKSHELFQSLSFEEIEHVSSFSASRSFARDEIVFQRQGYGSHFFIVVEGAVSLRLPSPDGESNLVVGRLQQGDIFGLSPLLGFERFTTTAQCTEQSTILAVEVDRFRALLEENSPVGLAVMNMVARAYFSRYTGALERIQRILDDLAVEV